MDIKLFNKFYGKSATVYFSILATLFLFSFGFCKQGQRIGKVIGGKYVITENIDNFKSVRNKTIS